MIDRPQTSDGRPQMADLKEQTLDLRGQYSVSGVQYSEDLVRDNRCNRGDYFRKPKIENRIATFLALVLFVLTLISCSQEKPQPIDTEEQFTGARYVRTATAVIGTIERQLSYSGTVKYDQAMDIIPSIAGKIDKIYVREGQNVTRGQTLAEIDKNSYAQYEANYNLAQRNFERAQNLLAERAIDRRSYEETENFYITAKTAFDFAKENLIVKAPFAGTIATIHFKENETYSPMSPGGLIRLVNNNSIYVEANVSDKDVQTLALGQKARIKAGNHDYDGTISFISPENDRMTGLNRIKIDLRGQTSDLRNNQFVTISLIPEYKENVVIIPKSAVLTHHTDNDKKMVILAQNGRSLYREVITGMDSRDIIEIISGLNSGDTVIIEGNSGLENDYPVTEFAY